MERQYVHLYISNKKSLIIAYLDNYKGREIKFGKEAEKIIPDRLKGFATIQFDNRVLLTGGMNFFYENPEDPVMSE